MVINFCLVFACSYMDTEQYEEAVRDYEKVHKLHKSRGNIFVHQQFLPMFQHLLLLSGRWKGELCVCGGEGGGGTASEV